MLIVITTKTMQKSVSFTGKETKKTIEKQRKVSDNISLEKFHLFPDIKLKTQPIGRPKICAGEREYF